MRALRENRSSQSVNPPFSKASAPPIFASSKLRFTFKHIKEITRLDAVNPESVTGKVKEMFTAIEANWVALPTRCAPEGNSSTVLNGYLSLSGALIGGLLGAKTEELIAITVAHSNARVYCLSARAFIASKMLKMDPATLPTARHVEAYLAKWDKLDLLINNAGIMISPYSKTEDGFESQIGANYFEHFLLTGLLLENLIKTPGARIVVLSSKAHQNGKINLEDLQSEKSYFKFGAYSQTKLACLLFAYELQRRLEAAGHKTLSFVAHPEVSNTELGKHFPKVLYYHFFPIFPIFMHKPNKAALPQLMAALNPDVKGGEYFGPTSLNGMKGKPGKVESKPQAHDRAVAKKLWEVSEKLTGFKFNV